MKNKNTLKKFPQKNAIKVTLLAALLLFTFYLPGCTTMDQSEQIGIKKDLNYLLAMDKGVRKKVEKIQLDTDKIKKDVRNTTTGFISLEVETRSALAESNAELEKFREEFGFVRGGIEETSHVREQFRDDISELESTLLDTQRRLDLIEKTSSASAENSALTTNEFQELLASLSERTADFKARIDLLEKENASLVGRLEDMEAAKIAELSVKKAKAEKSPAELYMEGYQQADEKNYSKAIRILKNFIRSYPDNELADKAQFWLAESYLGKEDYERAILEFNRVIKKFPDSEKVGPSYYRQGLSFLRLGAEKEARVIFERVVESYPDTDDAKAAGKRLKKMKLLKKEKARKKAPKANPASEVTKKPEETKKAPLKKETVVKEKAPEEKLEAPDEKIKAPETPQVQE